METIITRDTDVIREYLAALDARERTLSPFARLAAMVKLAQLKKGLATAQLETTEEDLRHLHSEIDERMNRKTVVISDAGGLSTNHPVDMLAGHHSIHKICPAPDLVEPAAAS
jgi:hypothetical protein